MSTESQKQAQNDNDALTRTFEATFGLSSPQPCVLTVVCSVLGDLDKCYDIPELPPDKVANDAW